MKNTHRNEPHPPRTARAVFTFLRKNSRRYPAFYVSPNAFVTWEEFRFSYRRRLAWSEGEEPTDIALRLNFGRFELEIPFEVLIELVSPSGRRRTASERVDRPWEADVLRWRSQETSLDDLPARPGVRVFPGYLAFSEDRKRLDDRFDGDALKLALNDWWGIPRDPRPLPAGAEVRHELAELTRKRIRDRFPGAFRDLIPPAGDLGRDLRSLAASCLVECRGDARLFARMAAAAHAASWRAGRGEPLSRAYSAFGRVALVSRLERMALRLFARSLSFGSVAVDGEAPAEVIEVLEGLETLVAHAGDRDREIGLRRSIAAWNEARRTGVRGLHRPLIDGSGETGLPLPEPEGPPRGRPDLKKP